MSGRRVFGNDYESRMFLLNNEIINGDGGPACNTSMCILCGRVNHDSVWGNMHSKLFYALIKAKKTNYGIYGETRMYNDICTDCIRIIPEGRAKNVNLNRFRRRYLNESENRYFDPLLRCIKSPYRNLNGEEPNPVDYHNYHGFLLSYEKMARNPRVRCELLNDYISKKLIKKLNVAYEVMDRCVTLPYLPEDVKYSIKQFVA